MVITVLLQTRHNDSCFDLFIRLFNQVSAFLTFRKNFQMCCSRRYWEDAGLPKDTEIFLFH